MEISNPISMPMVPTEQALWPMQVMPLLNVDADQSVPQWRGDKVGPRPSVTIKVAYGAFPALLDRLRIFGCAKLRFSFCDLVRAIGLTQVFCASLGTFFPIYPCVGDSTSAGASIMCLFIVSSADCGSTGSDIAIASASIRS
jgi:hypothetical protein